MSVKSQLKRSLYQCLKRDRCGSFATRWDRRGILQQALEQVIDLGYKIATVEQIKPKHIQALVRFWQQKKLAVGTIKNRLAALRYLADVLQKLELVASNKVLQVGSRITSTRRNKACVHPDLSKITDPYVKASVELQRVFGLRREESLKIKPHLADQGNKLSLLGSWCKGNRSREIPIRTEEQRGCLDQAKGLLPTPNQSLIPEAKSYIQHRYVYDKQLQRAGIKSHGLRHAYAQQRYFELTGWLAPIAGGPKFRDMNYTEQNQDIRARMILSEELGHSRIQIVQNYLF